MDHSTKRSGLFACALLVLFGVYSYYVKSNNLDDSSLAVDSGETFPSFTLNTLEAKQVSLDSVVAENKYVWVNFWATWCGPCRREMPMMSELYNEFSDKGFEILAISVSEEKETIQEYLDEYPVPFTVLMDPNGELAQKIKVQALPTSFLIDSTGAVQRLGVGIQQSWEFTINRELSDE